MGTALMVVAEIGNAKLGDLLLKKGCNVNAKDTGGMTAFMISLKANKPAFAELLLDQPSIDVQCKNMDNQDAQDLCVLSGLYAMKAKIDAKSRLKDEDD